MLEKVIEILEQKHGKKLNIKEDIYYLFFKDAVFSLYYDENEKTLQCEIEMVTEEKTFVYYSDKSIENLI
jgi:hypothetical protein